jgi:ABC-2 type transport system permease protein
MMPVSKVWRLFRRYAAINLAEESEFRTDFLSSVVLQLLYAVMMIAFWDGLIRVAGGIPGWSMGDLVLMTGMQLLSGAVSGLFFRMNQLPGKVLKGELDRYLTKPVPPLLCLQWERLPLRAMVTETASAIIVTATAILGWGFRPVPGGILPGLLLLILGSLMQNCFQTVVAAASFWAGRVDGLQQTLGEMNRFRAFPVTLFDQPVRWLLTWVWPFGLYLTYPVLLLRGAINGVWPLLGGGFLAALAWSLMLGWLLRAGLNRYESFGG